MRFFTPFFVFVSLFGKGGIFFLVLGTVLLLFKKTRSTGLSVLLAVGIGALFTNVIIKNVVARPRPYTVSDYHDMWVTAGSTLESEYSFPSGHTTVTMTSLTAVFLSCNKKWSWVGFIFVVLMGLSRMYLFVHYLTDVIGGIIVGGVSGTVAYFISREIFNLLRKRQDNHTIEVIINFDLLQAIKKRRK